MKNKILVVIGILFLCIYIAATYLDFIKPNKIHFFNSIWAKFLMVFLFVLPICSIFLSWLWLKYKHNYLYITMFVCSFLSILMLCFISTEILVSAYNSKSTFIEKALDDFFKVSSEQKLIAKISRLLFVAANVIFIFYFYLIIQTKRKSISVR